LIIEFADDMVESIHISDAIDIMPEAPQSVESREVFQNQIVSEERFAVIPEARKQIKSDVMDETPTVTENIIQEFVVSEEPIEMLFDQIESADINEAPAVTEVPNEGIPETSDPAESADLIQDFVVSEIPIEILLNALDQIESVDSNVPLVTELPIEVISETVGAESVDLSEIPEVPIEFMPEIFEFIESDPEVEFFDLAEKAEVPIEFMPGTFEFIESTPETESVDLTETPEVIDTYDAKLNEKDIIDLVTHEDKSMLSKTSLSPTHKLQQKSSYSDFVMNWKDNNTLVQDVMQEVDNGQSRKSMEPTIEVLHLALKKEKPASNVY
jgi:hypothetical protein